MASTDPSVPYGYCHCGCGEKTKLYDRTVKTIPGWVEGEPKRYVKGHGRRGPAAKRSAVVAAHRKVWEDADIPYGLCLCGCGERTPVSSESDFKVGRIQGEPRRYVRHHENRSAPQQYIEEDRGHDTPCWIWQWNLSRQGYAMHRDGLGHRVLYEHHAGPIPEGLQLDHLCRVPSCVNPAHMEPVTGTENVRRSGTAKLTMDLARSIRAEFGVWGGTRFAYCRLVAERHNMHPYTIDMLLSGKTWREDVA